MDLWIRGFYFDVFHGFVCAFFLLWKDSFWLLQYEPSSILLENSQDAHFEQTFFYFFILNIYKSYFYSCLQPVVGLLFQAMVFGMLYLQKQLLIVVAGCLLMLQLHKLLKYAATMLFFKEWCSILFLINYNIYSPDSNALFRFHSSQSIIACLTLICSIFRKHYKLKDYEMIQPAL